MIPGNLLLTSSRWERNRLLIRPGFFVLFTMLLLTAGCSSKGDLDQPPEIRYGEDVCDRCSMIINEARFAAAYVNVDGVTLRFDDIGGMLSYVNETGEEVSVFWVHDYETEEWLKADAAFFVAAEDLQTPMGFGIIAFTTSDQAESWAESEGGMVMSFSELMGRDTDAEMIGHEE